MEQWQTDLAEAFADSFMQPRCYKGDSVELEALEAGLDVDHAGYYAKLSADGFMDQTDLHGPFKSPREAAEFLIETYTG